MKKYLTLKNLGWVLTAKNHIGDVNKMVGGEQ